MRAPIGRWPRAVRARPLVAIYIRIAENSAQQVYAEVYAEVAPVGVRNGLAGRRHDLMLGAREWAIVTQVLQLTNKLCSRTRREAGHETSLAVSSLWRGRDGHPVKFGQLQLGDVSVDVEPVFERGKEIVACILDGLSARP